ncbi:MAG: radical SAM protein, partial [Elusimicrobia bacterium]|nr:radical SAM protein [Elusimicrobiota bacterium]
MVDICFVIPPSPFLLDERVFMALGVLRVAAAAEASGLQVELLDLSGIANYEEVARLHARTSDAPVFGITATTPQMPAAARAARAIRGERPSARLILGGPHATLVNAAARSEHASGRPGRAAAALSRLRESFDVVVAGDGELSIFEAMKPDAPGLIDADDPASPLFLTSEKLDRLPLPARHLVDVESYRYSIEGVPAVSLVAQLGCPFNCGFCGGRQSPSLRRVRMRSTAGIVSEMLGLHRDYGFRGFMLYDDELNVNPRMIELMNAVAAAQAELGVEFRLRGFVKAELFNDEQAEAMHRAGFRWLLAGFESGCDRILRNMNKKATRAANTRCVETARRHGLKVKALMSVGHPGETRASIAETRDWLLRVKPEDFDVSVITAYPGTPYYDHARPLDGEPGTWIYSAPGDERLYLREIDFTEVADYYKGDPEGGYRCYVR